MFFLGNPSLKEKLLLSVFFVGALSIGASFFQNLSFPDSQYNFIGEGKRVKLDNGKSVTQLFVAKENNLNQLKIIVGNADVWPGEKIIFKLALPDCETILSSDSYTFFSPEPHIFYHFNFPSQKDSAQKEYCFKISYFSPFERGDARPFLAATEGESFKETSYIDTKEKIFSGRTLQMRPAYGTGSISSDIEMLSNRISQYKPTFLKSDSFMLLFGIFLLGTTFIGIWVVLSKEKN